MRDLIFISVLYISVISILSPPAEGLVCPPESLIAPCACAESTTLEGVIDMLVCSGFFGDVITQDSVNNLFSHLRSFNNLTSDDLLTFNSFTIFLMDPSVTSLDLTPLLYTKIVDHLSIGGNDLLTSLTGPLPVHSFEGLIDTTSLIITTSTLTTEGIGESLYYFSPIMTKLAVAYSDVEGGNFSLADGSGDIEFLPGLSRLVNLDSLDFAFNKVEYLGGGQFKRNNRLREITFQVNKGLQLNEDAFLFDEPDEDMVDEELEILLGECGLTSSQFKSETLMGIQRPVKLDLEYNELDYLEQEFFEPFLTANEGNSLWVSSNKFVCDNRMKYIKDKKDEWEFQKVWNCNCANDPGKTVFTTSLID